MKLKTRLNGPRPRETYRAWRRNNAVKWIGVEAKSESTQQVRKEDTNTAQASESVLHLRVREDTLRPRRSLYSRFHYPDFYG